MNPTTAAAISLILASASFTTALAASWYALRLRAATRGSKTLPTSKPPVPRRDDQLGLNYARPAHTEYAELRDRWNREHGGTTKILPPDDEPPTVPTHACPTLGEWVTPCCGRSPHELLTHRMTVDPDLVTCGRTHPTTTPQEP